MENNRHFGRWYICINFTLCMPTCNRNLMRRLLEHKTRINLLAETNSLLGRCLEFQKQSKFIKTLSLKSDMRILKAELKSEAFRYLPQKKKKKNIYIYIYRVIYWESFRVFAPWNFTDYLWASWKKKKKRTKTILTNLNEGFFIICFHVQMFKWSAVNWSKFCMYFNFLINNCNKLFHSSDLSNNLLRRIYFDTFRNMDKLEIV